MADAWTTIAGMIFGTKAEEVFPGGWIPISIAHQWIPTITQNLEEMEWVFPSYTDVGEKFLEREKRVFEEAAQESQTS